MFGRRDQYHHAPTLTRIGVVLLLLSWLPAAGFGQARADTRRVAPDGTVHSVSVVSWQQSGTEPGSGTALRYTRQAPDGSKTSFLIPGTDDLAVDRDPALELVGGTSAPVVVWSRNEALRDRLTVSALVGGTWTAPRHVFPSWAGQRRPQVQVLSSWIHVSWDEDYLQGGLWYMRGVLDPLTLAERHGPERLLTESAETPIPPSGQTGGADSPEPDRKSLHFSGSVEPGGSGPGKIVIWGVRDEPIPITYTQAFLLPAGVQQPTNVRTDWLNDRFTLSYRAAGVLYYTMHVGGRWTDTRVVRLGVEGGAEEAILQIQEMIRRDSLKRP